MKKGFTLIELLVVIIILGIIGLIVVPTVTKLILTSKDKLYQTQVKMIEGAASKWGLEHINQLSETEAVYLGLNELLQSGYINQKSLKDPRNTGHTMDGCIVIEYDEMYSKYEYVYNDVSCTDLIS